MDSLRKSVCRGLLEQTLQPIFLRTISAKDHLTLTAPAALGSEITEQRHQKFKPVTLCLKPGHTGCPFFVIPFFLNVFLPNLNPLSGF